MATPTHEPEAVAMPQEDDLREWLELETQLGKLRNLKNAQTSVGWRDGEYVHLLRGFWNKKHAYCVSCDTLGLEGWLPGGYVDFASSEEMFAPTLEEVMKRCTWVRALEERATTDMTELVLTADNLVRLLTVKQGWGWGWKVSDPERIRGWFPLSQVEVVYPSLEELVVEMNKGWGEARPEEEDFDDIDRVPSEQGETVPQEPQFDQPFGDEYAAGGMEQDYAFNSVPPTRAAPENLFETHTTLREDQYPLFTCKKALEKKNPAMLEIEVGDLIRVTSPLDASHFYGFRVGNPQVKGWFPNTLVERIETDCQPSVGNLTVPQMEEIPAWLIQPPLPA
mmetsp:Transcript_72315/g.150874  ORF Transcript_72315/g.150874 Transcript_72315/m.150874 type:complete len:337 (+) Transcript_72315:91-1101(+)|eukprot:CAMPEP_0206456526 /NCGR_PEP_ID=MMETSP0324_2-20121206/22424_1 /ASSEMBLY_ACC=CAM_ASM_000836 /TAXON_ID=2866 /ORGANISM="Crypthecodinium cohnii, Strain Seligo" /LENGTH=336 /DNA_ID=CAMNT_0053927485 /DNA_START=23 /DNA_END=1033 /DNA_ORIENTATION=+